MTDQQQPTSGESAEKSGSAKTFCEQYPSKANELIVGVKDPLLHQIMEDFASLSLSEQAGEVERLKLALTNEKLNSESLHRYWDRSKEQLTAEREASKRLVETMTLITENVYTMANTDIHTVLGKALLAHSEGQEGRNGPAPINPNDYDITKEE